MGKPVAKLSNGGDTESRESGETDFAAAGPDASDVPLSLDCVARPAAMEVSVAPDEAASFLAASPVAMASAGELPIETRGDDLYITFGDRQYRVRGMRKNTSFDSLRINVMLTRASVGAVYLDTFDLAVARQRSMFEKQAAAEIGVKEEVVHREMGRILFALERMRDEEIERAKTPDEGVPQMSNEERAAAIAFLQSPDLATRISDDLTRCGLVGETTNKLVAYLAATSRKLDRPLAMIIQSSSAAGKSALMDAVLGFCCRTKKRPLFGDDRTVALLHRPRRQPQTQGAGDQPKRRALSKRRTHSSSCRARGSCRSRRPEKTLTPASSYRRSTTSKDHHAVHDDDCARGRRRAAEPLHRAHG